MFTKGYKFASVRLALALVLMVGAFGSTLVHAMKDPSPLLAGATWYVATTGDDSNSCSSAGSPCATINGARAKSSAGDSIKVATGTYEGGVVIDKSLQVTGGWNDSFTTPNGFSVIDGHYTKSTLSIAPEFEFEGPITVEVSWFIIQHSNHEGLSVAYAIFTLSDTTIRDNRNTGYGGGIYSLDSTIVLNNVTITGNYSVYSGGGLWFYGETTMMAITIKNSTIANNSAGFSGGGIVIENAVVNLRNSILANNTTIGQGADCLGVISNAQNTIIKDMTGCTITSGTGNQLNTNPLIGSLPIGRPGYHALMPSSPAIDAGNPATCLTTDARGVARPQGGACDIGAYEFVSPAAANAFDIIRGTPQETAPGTTFSSLLAVYVVDATGNPISGATVNFTAPASGAGGTFVDSGTSTTSGLTDQAGVAFSSPFTANSQQGNYSVMASVAGLPGSVSFALTNAAWYVAPTGLDSNSCNTASSPCATMNKAIEKASDGDTILVAAGTYISVDEYGPVVSLDKDLTLSGGWNSAFTDQNDYSLIDGQNTKMGIDVGPSTLPDYFFSVGVDHFIIQNGKGYDAGGLQARDSDLTVKNSQIINNAGQYEGGGIQAFHTHLLIMESTIRGNTTNSVGHGGGINLRTGSSLTIRNAVIARNTAYIGGGIYVGGYPATLTNVTLTGNQAFVAGGLYRTEGYVYANNVTVTNNVATVTDFSDTGGGGIVNSGEDSNFIVENSLIAGNFAQNGVDCLGVFKSRGHNLIGTSRGCTMPAAPGDQIGGVNSPINPMLNELSDNGGPTLTHSLQINSPAIDSGSPSTCAGTDQRGITRPQGNGCDIGAYESQYITIVRPFKSAGTQDGWILETSESSNRGGTTNPTATTFLLGDTANRQQYRSVLSFNTSSLPDNAEIIRVVLKIKRQSVVGTNPFTTHGKIAIDIRKGAFSNNAMLQPTDFQAAGRLGVGLMANNPTAAGWYSVRLNNTILSPYINRVGITQLRLRFQLDDDNDAVADFLRFYSGNAIAANQPVLMIQYSVP